MRSVVVTTTEIDSPDLAVKELASSVRDRLELLKNSCGILYYDYEIDGSVLAGALQNELGFPIIGCSALATLDGRDGYHEMEAVLTVLTADDCDFSLAITDRLNATGGSEAVIRAYEQARRSLPDSPKLLYILCPADMEAGITLDRWLDDLSAAAGDIPMIGGLPSSPNKHQETVVMGGHITRSQAVLLLVSGNLRPICKLANVVTRFSGRSGTVTNSEHEILREVDGESFLKFVQGYGMNPQLGSEISNRIFFQKYPFLLGNVDSTDDTPYVRVFNRIDERGNGIAYASVPQNSTIALAVFQREDVGASVEQGIKLLLDAIEARKAEGDGYEYGTVICITCAARHSIMNPFFDIEGNAIRDKLPPHLSLSGFYSNGEICPTSISRSGKARNCLHNASIAFCAF